MGNRVAFLHESFTGCIYSLDSDKLTSVNSTVHIYPFFNSFKESKFKNS